MSTTAIILAAGQGKRMNSDKNKQFLKVKGKPIIVYTIEAFMIHLYIEDILLVVNEDEVKLMKEDIVDNYFSNRHKNIIVVVGGKERYNSVHNALNELSDDCKYVLIHDGARPLVSDKEISDSVEILKTEKASVLGVKAKNTYKLVDEHNYITTTVARENLYSILTPQSFHKSIIIEAYEKGVDKIKDITDDGMMVEKALHIPVKLIEGCYENIKITTPEDLVTMEKIIEDKMVKVSKLHS